MTWRLGDQVYAGALATEPTFGDKAYPHCNTTVACVTHTWNILEYLFTHTDYNVDTIVRWLENKDFKAPFTHTDPD